MESSHIGYASAGAEDEYIIVFEISRPHNLLRPVANKWYARYRCKKAYPIMIYHKKTLEKVDFVGEFRIQMLTTVEDYDYTDNGIQFYLSQEPAFYQSNAKGDSFYEWDPDGQLLFRRRGEEYTWYKDGIPYRTILYATSPEPNIMTRYYPDGSVRAVSSDVDGKLHGLFTHYKNNVVAFTCEYKDGRKHGKYITYRDGERDAVITYDENILVAFEFWRGNKLRGAGTLDAGAEWDPKDLFGGAKLSGSVMVLDAHGRAKYENYKNNKLVSSKTTRKIIKPNKT